MNEKNEHVKTPYFSGLAQIATLNQTPESL
jgi:hypothetical protein